MLFFYRLLNEELSSSELLHLLEESFEENDLAEDIATEGNASDESESV
jgi:hypothetical protein